MVKANFNTLKTVIDIAEEYLDYLESHFNSGKLSNYNHSLYHKNFVSHILPHFSKTRVRDFNNAGKLYLSYVKARQRKDKTLHLPFNYFVRFLRVRNYILRRPRIARADSLKQAPLMQD